MGRAAYDVLPAGRGYSPWQLLSLSLTVCCLIAAYGVEGCCRQAEAERVARLPDICVLATAALDCWDSVLRVLCDSMSRAKPRGPAAHPHHRGPWPLAPAAAHAAHAVMSLAA
jgi:hypothetical protein